MAVGSCYTPQVDVSAPSHFTPQLLIHCFQHVFSLALGAERATTLDFFFSSATRDIKEIYESIMALYKYYCDTGGITIELTHPQPMANQVYQASFPGVRGFPYDGYHKIVARSQDGRLLPITRRIEYKRNPSLHECNAKCLNGKCSGICECRCGGKNHGIGNYTNQGNKNAQVQGQD